MLWRVRRILPALWAGLLLGIAAIAAPAAFANLASADAGRVVGYSLAREAWVSLLLAALLLVPDRVRGTPGRADALLLWGTVACTLLGYFAVQPLMVAARAGQGRVELRPAAPDQHRVLRRQDHAGAGSGLADRRRPQSTAFFLMLVTRGLARLISPPAVTRWLPKTLTFLICGR